MPNYLIQEEIRKYTSDSRYLTLLPRRGGAKENMMSNVEYSRNILMFDNDVEVWRINSIYDDLGKPFTRLLQTNSEYIADRDDTPAGHNIRWLLNIETGEATPYPPKRDPYNGERQQLFTKLEHRMHLNDLSYLILTVNFTSTTPPRNISRISATGQEMWRISVNPKIDADPTYAYEALSFCKDGTLVASMDERLQYVLDMETGKATRRLFS